MASASRKLCSMSALQIPSASLPAPSSSSSTPPAPPQHSSPYLTCTTTQLTTLPAPPQHSSPYLTCTTTQLTTLPASTTQLTTLPAPPHSSPYLTCTTTQLTTLPASTIAQPTMSNVIYNFYSPDNNSKEKCTNIHHKTITHARAAECRCTFMIVHAQLWQMDKRYETAEQTRAYSNDKQSAYIWCW